MSLSDSCSEFLGAIISATKQLQNDVESYADPTFDYPPDEILALSRACIDVQQEPWNVDASVVLVRLATAIVAFHDALPDSAEGTNRRKEMEQQIAAMAPTMSASFTDKVDKLLAGSTRLPTTDPDGDLRGNQ